MSGIVKEAMDRAEIDMLKQRIAVLQGMVEDARRQRDAAVEVAIGCFKVISPHNLDIARVKVLQDIDRMVSEWPCPR